MTVAQGKQIDKNERTMDDNEVRQDRFRKFLVGWMVVFTLTVGWMINDNRQLAKQGKEAHDGICTLKKDYQERNIESVTFLKNNPNGLPGIPADIIENSIRGRRNTIQALDVVTCKGENSER